MYNKRTRKLVREFENKLFGNLADKEYKSLASPFDPYAESDAFPGGLPCQDGKCIGGGCYCADRCSGLNVYGWKGPDPRSIPADTSAVDALLTKEALKRHITILHNLLNQLFTLAENLDRHYWPGEPEEYEMWEDLSDIRKEIDDAEEQWKRLKNE
jgi:hypothetical protein